MTHGPVGGCCARGYGLLLLILVGCQRCETAPGESRAEAGLSAARPSAVRPRASTVVATAMVSLRRKDGSLALEVTRSDAGTIKLRLAQREIGVVQTPTGRRYLHDDGTSWQIEKRSEGFMLLSESGEPMWRVRLKRDRVVIVDPLRTERRYVVKMRDDGTYLLKRDGSVLGKARLDDGRARVLITGAAGKLVASPPQLGTHWLLAAARGIPKAQRYVLLAEIFFRSEPNP